MLAFYRSIVDPASWSKYTHCRRFASVYTKTLNLPTTKFPTFVKKAKRPEHDKNIREKHLAPLYRWQREHLKGEEFILHDGPPYANGDLHMGHAINKITKDFILRSQIMRGIRVHYKPGWDCHGLPIEMKAKSGGSNPSEIRNNARKFATETIEKQRSEFESWGVTADWKNRANMYRTYDSSYIQNQLNLFHELYAKNLIFRDLKPVYWSPSSKTALAEAELEYDKQHVSPSLYVRFKLNEIPESIKQEIDDDANVYALIWTTTPWTLPANQAIAFNSSLQYSLVKLDETPSYYIVATDLIPKLREALIFCDLFEVESVSSDQLANCKYVHPISGITGLPFLKGNHVTAEMGTGLVHTAPAHGFDDHLVALSQKIPIHCVVDSVGRYNKDAPEFLEGKEVIVDGNRLCLQHVKNDTIHLGEITHSCPIDWRTKQPVIINATHQWFINIEEIRDSALSEIEKISICTTSSMEKRSENQLSQKIRQRPYWCISRQRVWGTPIPVFYRKDTDEVVATAGIVEHLNELLSKSGTIDFWWEKDVEELIPEEEFEKLNLKPEDVVKGKDILDIWFDSGISWSQVLEPPKVADLYLEGYDQFTGWFQSSLITSVAARGIAPFKSIFVHGFAVDENGTKMSKSLGNVTHPKEIIGNYNIDTLRWWTAKHLIGQTATAVKSRLIEQSATEIQQIRTVLRFLMGYLDQMQKINKSEEFIKINHEHLTPIEIFILNSVANFDDQAQKLSKNYRYPSYVNNILSYVNDELSSFFLHTMKDRLYLNPKSDNVELLNVMLAQFCILIKVIWPIIPHLAEECWSYYDTQSFYKTKFNVPNSWHNNQFDESMAIVKNVITILGKDLPKSPFFFRTVVTGNGKALRELEKLHPNDGEAHDDSYLCELLRVQSVQLRESDNAELSIEKFEINESLCERCRRFAVAADGEICKRCKDTMNVLEAVAN